jgi:hypothetical protein
VAANGGYGLSDGFEPTGDPAVDQRGRYRMLWDFWSGAWLADPAVRAQRRQDPRLYKNTRLVWGMARAIVRLYAQGVYQGDLSTDGGELPDGSRGAIPIDPQTAGGPAAGGGDAEPGSDLALRRAISELWAWWNWRQHMRLRPRWGAMLGDVLVEVLDDWPRARVYPVHVWPGKVVEMGLDPVGNVKWYALEYEVSRQEREAFGRRLPAASYAYRKEVDGEAFRHYADGKPYGRDHELWGMVGPPVQPNPYGFVPAVWDRHEIIWGWRGLGAIDGILQALQEFNSVLSNAMDFQRRQFNTPIVVRGAQGAPRPRAAPGDAVPRLVLPRSAARDPLEAARADADSETWVPVGEGGGVDVPSYDLGGTVELFEMLGKRLQDEVPEAAFGQQVLEMTQVTAPGIERALGPVIGMVKDARSNYDPGTVKLHQMAISVVAYRLGLGEGEGGYPAGRLTSRHDAFRGYDLGSFGRGELDFSIPDRDVIPETLDERIDRLLKIEQLADEWSMLRAGMPPDAVARVLGDRERRRSEDLGAVTGAGDGRGGPAAGGGGPGGEEEEEGPGE